MIKPGRIVSSFSIRVFLLITFCVILPLSVLSFYVARHMELLLRERLTENVFQNIEKNESYISENLADIAYYSNVFVGDQELRNMLADPASSRYEIAMHFNEILGRADFENPEGIHSGADVLIIDRNKRVYSNWSQGFNDYSFIIDEPWVNSAISNDGHISWSLFTPAYIVGEQERYISLIRPILSDMTSGDYLGLLIISINQSMFASILNEFGYAGDGVFVLVDDGEILMSSGLSGGISPSLLKSLYEEHEGEKQGNSIVNAGDSVYLLSFYTIPYPYLFNGEYMKVFHFSDYGIIEREMSSVSRRINIVIAIVALTVLLGSFVISRRMVEPIKRVAGQLRAYRIGMRFEGLDPERRDEIGDLSRGVIKMNARIEKLFKSLKTEHEAKERYYYDSLRAQMNPHYVYNTLSTIRWMAMIRGADNVVEGIDNLASTLKYSMGKGSFSTVGDEIEHIRNYVYIHNIRYDSYVELSIDIPDEIMRLKTLRFILQPIVENSIIHGFAKDKPVLSVSIRAELKEGKLLIFVEDDGEGIRDEAIREYERNKAIKGKKLTGIGLQNVDEMIRLEFGDEYGITVCRRLEGGTCAMFILPVLKEGEDEKGSDS